MLIPLSYNVRSLFVRKATTVATAGGIALVVFVLASSLMLANGMKKAAATAGEANHAMVLRAGSDTEMASAIEVGHVGLILSAPGVKKDETGQPLGSGEIALVIALEKLGVEGGVSNIQVRGVDKNVMKIRSQVTITEGRPAQPGAYEAIIGEKVRGRFKGAELGQEIELAKNRNVKVVGIFDAQDSTFESEIWVDVEIVRDAFKRQGYVCSVTAVLDSPSKFDAFAAAVEGDKRLGLEAMREPRYFEKQSQGTTLFIQFMGSIIAFFFSVGAMIGAMITMYGAVAQRGKEIGTLRALGFSRFAILTSFLFESCVLALFGAVVGALGALGTTFFSFSMMNAATWQEVSFGFEPSFEIFIGSMLAGGLMGVLGGFFPAIRAANTSPVDAMRA
jgi:putative ABC transport system permease protein